MHHGLSRGVKQGLNQKAFDGRQRSVKRLAFHIVFMGKKSILVLEYCMEQLELPKFDI